ncbi:MAG: polysaccharide deacetylase family protein [Actinomycetota bacterium]
MGHPHLPDLNDAAVRDQLLRAEGLLRAELGKDPRPLFRFPYGDSDGHTLRIVNGLGYGSIRWTVDTLGWKGTKGGQSVDFVIARVKAALRPGAIVLMHVGSAPDHSTLDADALPELIQTIRSLGYSFVTVAAYAK